MKDLALRVRNFMYNFKRSDDLTFEFITIAAWSNQQRYETLIDETMEVLDLVDYCNGNKSMAVSMAKSYIKTGQAEGTIDMFYNKIGTREGLEVE